MNEKILKRHKLQVSCAKEPVRLPEPDLRTREQLNAARDVGRSVHSRNCVPHAHYAAPSIRNPAGPAAGSVPKAEAE